MEVAGKKLKNMSQTEMHRGILVEFPREKDEKDKDYLSRLLKDRFIEEKYEGNIQNYLYDTDIYEDVLYYRGILYSNEEHEELDEYADSFHKTEKGIEYFVSFYNGGTCLAEMLEEGIDKINKKE